MMKLTSEPRRITKPNPRMIPPRYIGFRLYWKAPSVTKVPVFPLESSVALFRKVLVALKFMNKPTISRAIPIRVRGDSNII